MDSKRIKRRIKRINGIEIKETEAGKKIKSTKVDTIRIRVPKIGRRNLFKRIRKNDDRRGRSKMNMTSRRNRWSHRGKKMKR